MYIKSIKPTKSSSTMILVFNDNSILPFSTDDLVKMNIKKHVDLTSELTTQIYQKSAEHQLWEYSLRQLSMLSQPEKTIAQKLKNFSRKIILFTDLKNSTLDTAPMISGIVSRLKERGLISNSDYAQNFVKKSQNKSKRQILAQLFQKGIDRSDLNQAVSSIDDKKKIRIFLEKKKYTYKNFTNYSEKNKIMASLYRRGYTLSDIKSVIDDLLNNR